MSRPMTEQEIFWGGRFGDEYVQRNQGADLLASNLVFFSRALRCAAPVASALELGANIGMNLRALRALLPAASLHAVEINASACEALRQLPGVDVTHASLLDHAPGRRFDLVLVKGVLIHLDPSMLAAAYDRIFAASGRYVLLAEYYNPSPLEVPYRGHANRLFKRDFAGELMARHASLALLDYGFLYRRDPKWPQDDITWFLLEKR